MRAARRLRPDLPVDRLLACVLDLGARRPAPSLPRRLSALFRDLSRSRPSRPADEIEDLIWALWISHPREAAAGRMAAAAEAMGAGALDLARPILDRLVADEPDWAEAWNKRATLAFVERRDADALGDIERTLRLEPRHFGAVSGFGQICLRNGGLSEARAAFQIALGINPHLLGLQEVVEELEPEPLMLH